MKYLIALLLLSHVGIAAIAQPKYSSSNKRAIKLYEEANTSFRARKMTEGVSKLLKALEIDSKFIEANYKLATTYALYGQQEDALPYFAQVTQLATNPAQYREAYYYTALDQLSKGNYAQARKLGEQYMATNPTVEKAVGKIQRLLRDCQFADEVMKQPNNFKLRELPAPLNQFYHQYFPSLTADNQLLVFTARENPEGKQNSDEDLMASRQIDGKWTLPKPLSPVIDSPNNEGTASISADGRVLVFTACESSDGRSGRKIFGQCDLFISYRNGDEWSEPQNLGTAVNSSAWESQPSLSADGRTLYFVSARIGGKGGLDIWVSQRGTNDKWLPAEPLSDLNTPADELSPFIHPNAKTLYFSSEGYPGLGGKDLFKSEYYGGKWHTPQNLGYPLNTHEDQLALFITADGKYGYYSVDQRDTHGIIIASKLMVFDVPTSIQPNQRSNYVKGKVYDARTQKPLGAQVELLDLEAKRKQADTQSDKVSGEYLLVLNQGAEYALEVHCKGYAFKSLNFNYTEKQQIEALVIDIPLDPIAQGTVFRLNNIFFEYNKYELQEKSRAELDELVQFMKNNAEVRGEIAGHTDNIGNAQSNMTLSLNRAKAVYEYLVQAGIPASRLSYKGYGSTKPDAPNDTEEGRARNRRIEFRIL